MRRSIACAIALVLLCAAPSGGSADDTFGLELDRRFLRALQQLADTCFECGEKARDLGLNSWARSYYDHALRYDPEHRNTRRVMGFRKRRNVWVLEEELVPLSDEIAEARRPELEAKLTSETEPIRRRAAEALWRFAQDKRLSNAQRTLAVFHTLRICPEFRDAQRAARARPADWWYRHWLDDEGDTLRERWIAAAPRGELIEERTPYEEACGFSMYKVRGEWVVVHTFLSGERPQWVEDLTQFTEAARKRSLDLLEQPDGAAPLSDEQRLHYSVFRQREHFGKFIEACSNIPDAAQRSQIARAGYGAEVYRPYGAVFLYPRTDSDNVLRDAIAHDLGCKAIVRHTGWNLYWLVRGFGYTLSTQMNGSTASTFYALQTTSVIDSGGRDALPGLGRSAAGWRVRVAMEVAAGTALSINELTTIRPADYSERDMAHAFAYTDFLLARHRPALSAFLEAAREPMQQRRHDGRQPEDASALLARLLTSLEMNEAEFTQAFQDWVNDQYLRLPE